MEEYNDDGASCMDDRDGILFVKPPEGIAKVKTEEPTQATSPFVLIYTCVDKAGNEADSKTRRVHVRDACAEASQQTGQSEKLCLEYDPPVCSAYGSCATVSPTVTTDEPIVAAFEPEVDTEPPKIALVALNSESKLARTTSGRLVMAESIVQGEKYEEPGYVCLDGTKDIKERVSVFGGGDKVDTSEPSADGKPAIVIYNCGDKSGNNAEEVQRWITVTPKCPEQGSVLCEDGSCSSSDGFCSSAGTVDVGTVEDAPTKEPDEAPTILLQGLAKVEIDAGQAYVKCPTGEPLSSKCDRGVVASDKEDGDLSAFVMACNKEYAKYGLEGCGISGAGTYEVDYVVEDSGGKVAQVKRTIVVLAGCPAGESRCGDGVTCTENGAPCEGDIDSSSDALGADPAPSNQPPSVVLIGSKAIKLKRFTKYERCPDGKVSSDEEPCEAGANAVDNEDGDLGAKLLACPPDDCLDVGCPGHEFQSKGLTGCLNMSATVQSTFAVNFMAFDSAGAYASDVRTVTLIEPCPEGQHWCPANDPNGRCETMTCQKLEALEKSLPSSAGGVDDGFGPVVALRAPAEMPFVLLYGAKDPGGMLRGCVVEGASFPECIATAIDAVDGDMSATLVAVGSSSECTDASLIDGLCAPGAYDFVLKAKDNYGREGIFDGVQFRVVEGLSANYRVRVNGTRCSTLLDSTTEESAAVRGDVASKLVLPRGHIRIRECTAVPNSESGDSEVVVNAVIEESSSRRARALQEANALEAVGAVESSPPSSGPEAEARRLTALQRGSEGLLRRLESTRAEVLDATSLVDSLPVTFSASSVAESFDDMLNSTEVEQSIILAKGDELLDLTVALAQALETLSETFDAGNSILSLDDTARELEEIASRALDVIARADQVTKSNVPDCNRGVEGARHTFYTVLRKQSVQDASLATTTTTMSTTTTTALATAPATILTTTMTTTTTMTMTTTTTTTTTMTTTTATTTTAAVATTTTTTSSTDNQTTTRMTARKLLRASGRSSNGPLQIQKKDADAPGSKEIWAGYNTLDDDFESMQMAELFYGNYTKPRVVGAGGAMRIIGGVLISQERSDIRMGCSHKRGGRFDSLLPVKNFCSPPANANAYGANPIFSLSVMNNGEDEPVLYDPKFRRLVDAFYNTTSELSETKQPYAFYRDTEISGGWEVFLDATASEAAMGRLMWYLRMGRLLDSRMKSVTFRVPMHHTKLNAIVDLSVKFSFVSSGKVEPKTFLRIIPLGHFSGASYQRILLYFVGVVLSFGSFLTCLVCVVRFIHYTRDATNAKMERETGVIVRRSFVVDGWDMLHELVIFSTPLLLFMGYMAYFVLDIYYRETFTYSAGYRWYDQLSADGRILLPKREGKPPEAQEGFPIGAFRHQLARDTSDQQSFLQLLDMIDSMGKLYNAYIALQIPIAIAIVSNIVRIMRFEKGFNTLFRAMRRSYSPVAVLLVVMIMICIGSAVAMHHVLGYRLETYRTYEASLSFTGELLVGEVFDHMALFGTRTGAIVSDFEIFATLFIFTFFPIITIFVMFQFVVAVFTDYFHDERERLSRNIRVNKINEIEADKQLRDIMEDDSLSGKVRTQFSAMLYSFGWRNLSAYVLSLDSKYLDGSPGAPRGFHAQNVPHEPSIANMNSLYKEDISRVISMDSIMDDAAKSIPTSLQVNHDSFIDLEADAVKSPGTECFVLHNHHRGLPKHAIRWLMTNRQDRRSLYSRTTLGTIGDAVLAMVLYTKQEHHHNENPLDQTPKSVKSGRRNIRLSERKEDQEIRHMTQAMQIDNLPELSSRLNLSIADLMLFEHLNVEQRQGLMSAVRLSSSMRKQFERKACHRLAVQLLKDLGKPSDSRFDHASGRELVRLVLMRARTTIGGLFALTSTATLTNVTLNDVAKTLVASVPRSAVQNSGVPQKHLTVAQLLKRGVQKASNPVWRAMSRPIHDIVHFIESFMPNRTFGGAKKLVTLLASTSPAAMLKKKEHAKQRAVVTVKDLAKSLGLDEDEVVESEFAEYGTWPTAARGYDEDGNADDHDKAQQYARWFLPSFLRSNPSMHALLNRAMKKQSNCCTPSVLGSPR